MGKPALQDTMEDEVYYPESDGKPLAETYTHLLAGFNLLFQLRSRYRDRADVFVGANQLAYYVKGDPKKCFAPDVYICLGRPKEPPRDTWMVWEEGPPDVIVEITSKKTHLVDKGKKKRIYAEIGVSEFYLFDPFGDYIRPRFRGYELVDGRYEPLLATSAGIWSPTLEATLRPEGLDLRLVLPDGSTFALPDEAMGSAMDAAAEARRWHEEAERIKARAARQEAELAHKDEELARQRAELDRKEAELADLRARLAALERSGW